MYTWMENFSISLKGGETYVILNGGDESHINLFISKTKLNSVALVHKRTIPTEWPPLVGEVSANFCG
jgi:hypothetical protein